MRRRSGTAPFQLFSFQDIITSVMGIVVLILLVLAIELSQRQLRSPAGMHALVRSNTAKALQDAEDTIANMRKELDAGSITEVAAISPSDLSRKENEASQLRPLLESQQSAARAQKAIIEQRLKAATESLEMENRSARLEEAAAELSNIDEAIEELNEGRRVVYRTENSPGKTAWLIELSVNEFRVARVGETGPPIQFSQPELAERTSALERWLANLSAQTNLIHLLIKPGCTDSFEQLEKVLRRRRFSVGFDVLGEDESAIDSEKGAGAPRS